MNRLRSSDFQADNAKELTAQVQYRDGKNDAEETAVICEHILDVIINGRHIYRIICTGSDLKELVTGRLVTDGLIKKTDDIRDLFFCKSGNEARVFLDPDMTWKDTVFNVSTCCAGNRTFLCSNGTDRLRKLPACEWKPEWVFALADEFGRGSKIHDMTGGSHVSILAREGKTLCVCEDIGRHNAVDKAVGYALLNGIPLSECMIFTSGRVPVDMVEKVISAGIPVLVSKSSPTEQSVKLAKEYGLNLICRAWPDRYACFS
ncbi:MAG: formate dehydrogenase accessory sulfurtransferase FdhD [Lachnospiraceae bacterium]|nr:formate dehydrogenase accessory sulfurtransferase FdhD [Lachnospiraceae bacterium]